MSGSSEAIDLENIFTKIVCDKQDYCFLCLRTSDERRLVQPKAFKNFLNATKIGTNMDILFVCYLCENQASNALKLFQAAVFASTLSLILSELFKINRKPNQSLLDTNLFKKILRKVNLSQRLTPSVIGEEVACIRKTFDLTETETLVMDHEQIHEAGTAPIMVASLQPGLTSSTTVVNVTPSILPDRLITNQIPSQQETCIILDDEEDPLQLTSTSKEENPPLNQKPLSHATLTSNLVITLDPPRLVTFEALLADQIKFPADYILHPIFLTESGDLGIPTLNAVITNGSLVFQDSLKQPRPLRIDIQMVKEILKGNREVFIQIYNTSQLPTTNSNLALDTCQNEFRNYPPKKMKIDGAMLHDAFCESKKSLSISGYGSVKEVIISDISSDMDERSKSGKDGGAKTDWEDKIPMDVISFMDAVDPNAHKVLGEAVPSGCDTMILGDVRSLAQEKSLQTDIIDLC